MVMFYKFKSAPNKTGRDLHKYNTRQRQKHKQTFHRLKVAAITLPQDINKTTTNKKLHKIYKLALNVLLQGHCYSTDDYFQI